MKEKKQVVGTLEFINGGHAYLINIEGESELEKLFIHKKNLNKGLNDDQVQVDVIPNENDTINKIQGVVVGIIERRKTDFSGVIEISKDKGCAFVRTMGNKMPVDIYVPRKYIHGAKSGDLVIVKFYQWKEKDKSPSGFVTKVLGKSDSHEAEMGNIMFKHNIDPTFSQEVINEAELISDVITESEIAKRKDMRNLITISIDPSNALDADDTLSYQEIDDEIEISINIADITHFIKPGTELDKEAYVRSTSVYFADNKVLPMFPKKLSNFICSLKSGSDKLSFSVVLRFNKKGEIVNKWFGRTVINVNKDYSYEEAQEIIENGVSEEFKDTDEIIIKLNEVAEKIRKERLKNDVLLINSQEIKFKLDSNNKPIGIVFKTSKQSNKLIEEFMLLANKETSKFIKSKGLPCINRAHEKPNEDKLESLKEFVKQFGYEIKTSNPEEIKSSINKMMEDSKNTSEANIISNLVTRTQQKAYYTTRNVSHYGLDFQDYSHFTSPIRRYSDVLIHRILAIAIGNDGYNIK